MPGSLTTPFDVSQPIPMPGQGVEAPIAETAQPLYSDEEILDLWKEMRRESIDNAKAFQIQWRRNIYYILFRQWIEYIAGRGWRDKRMAPWIPRPVTNKCKDTVLSIRAMFTAIKLGVNVRPNGADPKNVSAAATSDELAPVLHEAHSMNSALSEFDFWLIACGNAFLHTFVDYDIKYGRIEDPSETCTACQATYKSSEMPDSQCPDCGSTAFTPAMDEMGQPIVDYKTKGRPTTLVLSPLEIAFPNSYARFADLPYVVRLRWRTKRYFESNPVLKDLVPKITWEKTPNDENLALFQSLSQHNDLGVSSGYLGADASNIDEDGISEYEVWVKPTDTYPQGLVFRVYGDSTPLVAHLEAQEAIPGPLPYTDADGMPLFPFTHAGFEHVGGRIIASGPIDAIIQKQDQLNQLDSMILLIIQRMSNPVWLTPKGAEIQKFTGMPGLVLRYNAAAFGGNAKPERIEGKGPNASLFTIREQYIHDIEELTGATDALKGIKPGGDMPFSAMQLLVERSQARFANVFQSRGEAYKDWFKFAIELEREFGPDERTKATLSPNKRWSFQTFKRAQLNGSLSVVVEDGSTAPKTNLGLRAAVEHAAGLGMLNMQDPDQQYEGLRLFGLTKMVPTLDVHVQAALQKQQAFEEWVGNPETVKAFVMQAQQKQAEYQTQMEAAQQQQSQLEAAQPQPGQPMPTVPPAGLAKPPSVLEGSPLKWKPWYNATIHKQECLKWANGDTMRELFASNPIAEKLVEAHLAEIEAALAAMQAAMMAATAPKNPGGANKALSNSNRESTQGNEPSGNGEGTQNAGPR
jgi:hypothetical protein